MARVPGMVPYTINVYYDPHLTITKDYETGKDSVVGPNEAVTVLWREGSSPYHCYYIEYKVGTGGRKKRMYIYGQAVTIDFQYQDSVEIFPAGNHRTVFFSGSGTVYTGPDSGTYLKAGTIGNESIIVFYEVENGYTFIEYSTSSGKKRGYVLSSLIPAGDAGNYEIAGSDSGSVDVYGGPGETSYNTVGAVSVGEMVDIVNVENGWFYIDYYAGSLRKRGYVKVTDIVNGASLQNNFPAPSYTGGRNAFSGNAAADVYSKKEGATSAKIGSVSANESFTVLAVDGSSSFIEYSTSGGAKRGWIANSGIDSSKYQGALAKVTIEKLKSYYIPSTSSLAIGSAWLNEYVVILEKNAEMSFVEYNTNTGRKRGYVLNSGLQLINAASVSGIQDASTNTYKMLEGLNVVSGPGPQYQKRGSVGLDEIVSLVGTSFGYDYIQYATLSGAKRGYVPSGKIQLQAGLVKLPVIEHANIKDITYGTSGEGRPLKAYKIGGGKHTMILNFAIHGYEDNWRQDGYALTQLAENLLYFVAANGSIDVEGSVEYGLDLIHEKEWTLYVIPTSNPDGLMCPDGPIDPNNPANCYSIGKGRCTTRMFDSVGNVIEHAMDINRSFHTNSSDFKTYSEPRNYTGSKANMSRESQALKVFLETYRKTEEGSKNVFIDAHGWFNQIITPNDKIYNALNGQFHMDKKDSLGIDKGYVSLWAQNYITEPRYDSCLFEFPGNVFCHEDMTEERVMIKDDGNSTGSYQDRYIRAVYKLLRDFNKEE